jgi:hypothetical protein
MTRQPPAFARIAEFSRCRQYRYWLQIAWGGPKRVNFLMLNPSTADEIANDPTVERCERRARAWGYGGLIVTNIFAYRATDPRVMRAQGDPVGPANDAYIRTAAAMSDLVICAWGAHGTYRGRSVEVRRIVEQFEPHALRVSKGGEPCHPLYLPYELEPFKI